MSEPSSLYVRLPLDASAREAYRASTPLAPRDYPDWQPWVDSRPMHGGAFEVGELRAGSRTTCGEILDGWLGDGRFAGNSQERVDASGWTISMLEFSENYGDYVELLTVLRAASGFIPEGGRGVAVIHDFLWGDTETDVAVEMTAGTSRILDPPPPKDIEDAAAHLQTHADSIDPTS